MSGRQTLLSLGAVTALVASTSCGAAASYDEIQEPEVLRLNFSQNPSHPIAQALIELSEEFEERTDGRYTIEIFTDDTLVGQPAAIEQVQMGAIDFAVVSGSLMENYVEEFAVINLPYIFESAEHQARFLNEDENVEELYSHLEPFHLEIAKAYYGGVRNLYSTAGPISVPEDLSGQKIRVIASDTNLQMLDLMGGIGTPMGQGEMYTAMQAGVIDGAENNEIMFSYLSHYEIAPHYSVSEHLMIPDYLVTSPRVQDTLDPEAQEILEDLLDSSDERVLELFDEAVDQAVEEAAEAGAEFHEVDQEAFREAVQPLHEDAQDNTLTRDIYQSIVAAEDG